MTVTASLATGNKKAALDVRGNDLHESPPQAVTALLNVEKIPHQVWEPACGPGSIVKVLRDTGRDVLATDLVDYASPYQDYSGVDFLIPGIAESYHGQGRAIVTNPPFKNAHEFVARCPDNGAVCGDAASPGLPRKREAPGHYRQVLSCPRPCISQATADDAPRRMGRPQDGQRHGLRVVRLG